MIFFKKILNILFLFLLPMALQAKTSPKEWQNLMHQYVHSLNKKKKGNIIHSKNFSYFLNRDLNDFSVCQGTLKCKIELHQEPQINLVNGKKRAHVFMKVSKKGNKIPIRSGCYVLESHKKTYKFIGYINDCFGK